MIPPSARHSYITSDWDTPMSGWAISILLIITAKGRLFSFASSMGIPVRSFIPFKAGSSGSPFSGTAPALEASSRLAVRDSVFGRSAGALCWLHAWSRQPPASITATSAALQAAFVPLFILSILLIFHSPYLSGKIQAFNGGGEHKKSRFWADPYLSFRSQKRRASLKSLSNAYFILLYYSRKKCENHLFSSDRRGFWLNFALKMV